MSETFRTAINALRARRSRSTTPHRRDPGARRTTRATDDQERPDRPLAADGGGRRAEDAARHDRVDEDHVSGVPDGAGCTEIWEHLSERRSGEADADD